MITKIRVRNFRSIEDLEFEPTRLCALIGGNNTGKSNLLDAIETVLGKEWHRSSDFASNDYLDHDSEKDILIELEFDPPPVHQGYKNEDPKEVPVFRFELTRYKRASGDAQAGDPRLEATPLTRARGPVHVLYEAPKKGQRPDLRPLTYIGRDLKRQVPLVYVRTDRRIQDHLPQGRSSLLRRMLEDVAEQVEERTVEDEDGEERPASEVFAERLESALQVLRIEEFVELETLVRTRALENLGYDPEEDRERFDLRFGLFEPMDFFKAIRLEVGEGDQRFEAQELGHAAQNALVMAIFQAYERMKKSGAIFLIEEPEMYLHPHRCRAFYDTLRRTSKSNQVIYTTHSPHFVSVPDFDQIRLVYRDENHRTQVKAPSWTPRSDEKESLRKELDPTRSELFFASHVILVEGDTERLALPVWADRLGVDLDWEGVSIIEVGGKRNLSKFADIVEEFELPLTIVFDRDASDFKDKRDQEAEFNRKLQDRSSETVSVVQLAPDYEGECREAFGEEEYQGLCEAHGGVSKVIRARLIAADGSVEPPDFVRRIFSPYIDGAPA